jgi:hypothetical protein
MQELRGLPMVAMRYLSIGELCKRIRMPKVRVDWRIDQETIVQLRQVNLIQMFKSIALSIDCEMLLNSFLHNCDVTINSECANEIKWISSISMIPTTAMLQFDRP